MYYLLAVCASVCFALQFCMMKLYQKYTVNNLTSALVFNAFGGVIGLLVFLSLNGFTLSFTPFTFILSILIGAVTTTSVITSIKVLSYGKLSVYSLFMMLGGMALPYVFGLVVFSESLTVLKVAGMILLVISLLLTSRDKASPGIKKVAAIFYLLCLATFILNGGMSILSALQGRATEVWGYPVTKLYDFLIWIRIWTIGFSALALPLVFAEKKEQRISEFKSVKLIFKAKPIAAGIGYTVISTLGFILQQICTPKLDSSVLFPITTGGTVVLSAIFGRLFYKEKTPLLVWICIAGTALATVLFALDSKFFFPIGR